MITIEQITDDLKIAVFYEETQEEYYIGISTHEKHESGQPQKSMQIKLPKAEFAELIEEMEVLKCRYNG